MRILWLHNVRSERGKGGLVVVCGEYDDENYDQEAVEGGRRGGRERTGGRALETGPKGTSLCQNPSQSKQVTTRHPLYMFPPSHATARSLTDSEPSSASHFCSCFAQHFALDRIPQHKTRVWRSGSTPRRPLNFAEHIVSIGIKKPIQRGLDPEHVVEGTLQQTTSPKVPRNVAQRH